MSKKIMFFLLIAALAAFSIGCGEKASEQSSQEQSSGSQPSNTDSEGLEWPAEYMSTLPAPDSKISRVEKLNGTEEIPADDTATQPSSVNVVMNEMTNEEALSYYETLKNSGFNINTDENGSDQIRLIGTLNDTDQNPFLFNYIPDENFGNVSITILKVLYGGSETSPDGMSQ